MKTLNICGHLVPTFNPPHPPNGKVNLCPCPASMPQFSHLNFSTIASTVDRSKFRQVYIFFRPYLNGMFSSLSHFQEWPREISLYIH